MNKLSSVARHGHVPMLNRSAQIYTCPYSSTGMSFLAQGRGPTNTRLHVFYTKWLSGSWTSVNVLVIVLPAGNKKQAVIESSSDSESGLISDVSQIYVIYIVTCVMYNIRLRL